MRLNFSFSHLTNLAGQEGLEPPTIGFGIRRSTIGAIALLCPYAFALNSLTSLLYGVCVF